MNPSIDFTNKTGITKTFPSSTLLVFIDETGEENLKDKKFPIFGFGGCVCTVANYIEFVNGWKQVEATFPVENIPLHAADLVLSTMTEVNIQAINNFFKKENFGRFAAVISDKTIYDIDEEKIHMLAATTYKRIVEISQYMPFDEIVMIFEESERTKLKISDYFSRYKFQIDKKEIPTERFFMSKKQNEAGLVVADFISHTSGAYVKGMLAGKNNRRDFDAIFKSVDKRLCSFIKIDSIFQKK